MSILVRLCLIIALVPLISAAAQAAATSDSGVYVDVRSGKSPDAPTERYKLYGASHALVIGIDTYSNGWPRLSNAVKDARLVARELEGRGFEVQLLTNVSGDELRRSLRQFFGIKGSDPEARLFVWFAGHGHTQYGEGYLVPADAPDPSDPSFVVSALHMGDVASMARIARSKHAFAVFDSCFAGTVFSAARSKPPAAVTQAAVQPVRQFLTSGDADQQVSDDGTFRRLFLRALRGEEQADLNGDGYLTGTELGFYLEDRVVNLTQAQQTPRSGKLRDPRFDRGDFIFVMPDARIEVNVAASNANLNPSKEAIDLTFWQSIQDSDSPEDYQAYLDTFPTGSFARLAEARLQSLERGAKTADAQSSGDEAGTANAALETQLAEQKRQQDELKAQLAAQQKRQAELEESLQTKGSSITEQSAALPPEPMDLSALDGHWKAESRGWRITVEIENRNFLINATCGPHKFNIVEGKFEDDSRIDESLFRRTRSTPFKGHFPKIPVSNPFHWDSSACKDTILVFKRAS